MKAMMNKQGGFGFSGFLMVTVLLILLVIGGLKVIPAYMQNAELKSIFEAIVHDPELQGAPVKAVRDSFYKRASMNNISSPTADQIEISKDNGKLMLSLSYQVKIPLAGNASLLLDFTASSGK